MRGVIGGQEQKGKWGMDARFNRDALAERIRVIGRMRRDITVFGIDAVEFLDAIEGESGSRMLVNLDPPYYSKGKDLYTNYYRPEDHESIAQRLKSFDRPWILTYDDCPEIRELYEEFSVFGSELSYSARQVRRGNEVVILSNGLRLPPDSVRPTSHRPGFEILAHP